MCVSVCALLVFRGLLLLFCVKPFTYDHKFSCLDISCGNQAPRSLQRSCFLTFTSCVLSSPHSKRERLSLQKTNDNVWCPHQGHKKQVLTLSRRNQLPCCEGTQAALWRDPCAKETRFAASRQPHQPGMWVRHQETGFANPR